MAREKDKFRHKQWAKKPNQKLTDAYTGFPVYATQVEHDYNGRLVKKGLADTYPIDQFKIVPRGPTPLPFRRPFGDEINVSEIPSTSADYVWNLVDEDWETSEFQY